MKTLIFEQGSLHFSFCTEPCKLCSGGDGGEGRGSWLVSFLGSTITPTLLFHTPTLHSHTHSSITSIVPSLSLPMAEHPGGPGSQRSASCQEAPTESGSRLDLETPLGTAPAPRACWPGHPNSHPLTVLSSRLCPALQLKCETTAGRQPRGLGFHHIQLPTPRPEARVRRGCWPEA